MIVTHAQSAQTRIVRMRKGVVAAAKAIDDKLSEAPVHYRKALVTLTYRPSAEWEPKHLSELCKHYREWFRKRGFAFHYVWVIEYQQNGKPHYHLVTWFPKGHTPPFPDKQGWWTHGLSEAKFARSPVGYIAKYASKTESKSGVHLPKGARLWGYGGLKLAEKAPVAFALAPRWLKHLAHHKSHPRKQRVEVQEQHLPSHKRSVSLRRTVTTWVLTAGLAAGTAFVGPYDLDNFSPDGLVLRHRGVVEVHMPNGDFFLIPHKGER